MKLSRGDRAVLVAAGVALVPFLWVIIRSKRQEAAVEAATGSYRYVQKRPKQTPIVSTYTLEPDGTFLLREDANLPFPRAWIMHPETITQKFGQLGRDYLVNPDSTVAVLHRGTFSVRGDEVELKMTWPMPRPILPFEQVETFRLSGKGLTSIQSNCNPRAELKDVAPDQQKLLVRIQ